MPRHGPRDKAPGQKKRLLFAMCDGRCQKCGVKMVMKSNPHAKTRSNTATLQHMKPKAFGGSDDLCNLQVWCSACNHADGILISQRVKDVQ